LSYDGYRMLRRYLISFNLNFLAPLNQLYKEQTNRAFPVNYKLDFPKMKDGDEIKSSPCYTCDSLVDLVQARWEELTEKNQIIDQPDFDSKIWISIGGDAGGGTTKLVFNILNVEKPNSVHNVTIIGYYSGNDKGENLRIAFPNLPSEFNQLSDLKLPFKVGDNEQRRGVKLFLFGKFFTKCTTIMYVHLNLPLPIFKKVKIIPAYCKDNMT
jgi:hypothetical protein